MTAPFQMQIKRLCVFMSLALCTCCLTAQNSAPTILWDKAFGGNDMEDFDAIDIYKQAITYYVYQARVSATGLSNLLSVSKNNYFIN